MLKANLVVTTAAAVALAGFTVQSAAAAPQVSVVTKNVSNTASQSQAQDFSAARKKRRGYGRGFPIGAFGAIVGTIAGIAAAESRREYYAVPNGYYEPGYAYGPGYTYGPGYAYEPSYADEGPVYEAPVGPPAYVYAAPGYRYRHGGGYRHFGGGSSPRVNAAIVNRSPGSRPGLGAVARGGGRPGAIRHH
jgi:hypothetical protein